MSDKFSKLRAIQSGQATTSTAPKVRFWSFERDGDIIGTIIGFNSFTHPIFGEQHTIIVRLAESDELISAILSGWVQDELSRKQAAVGDLILLQFFGKPPGERYNLFNVEIEKTQLQMF